MLSANGMLPTDVYEKLFDLARHSDGGTFVEIGTAHGAASIALALGAIEAKKPFHIYTVDPFHGKYSSRSKFGSVQYNVAFVQSQFRKFGVDQYITIIAGDSGDLVGQNVIENVNILLLDADGRIDRDLGLLFEKLSPGCEIIIDDIDDAVYMRKANGFWLVDQKQRLVYLLTNMLSSKGILRNMSILHLTGFFEKGAIKVSGEEIERIALPVYRDLVSAESRPVPAHQRAMDWTAYNIPFVRRAYRKAKGYFSKLRELVYKNS